MPFAGNGVFNVVIDYVNDAANGIKILATRQMVNWNDVAQNGLTNCVTKDGQSTTTALIPFALGISALTVDAFAAGTGVPIEGSTDNSDAATGYVGEYISASVAFGAALGLTGDVPVNLTSISLPAGDWDVNGIIAYTGNAATAVTHLISSINTTSATPATTGTLQRFESSYNAGYTPFAVGAVDQLIGPFRLKLASTTTVYLIPRASFGTNVCSAYGQLGARRVR